MKAFEKNQEQLNVWKTYANMAAMAQGLQRDRKSVV